MAARRARGAATGKSPRAARLLQRQQPTAHRGAPLGLAPDPPPLRPGRGKVGDGQRAAVWPDNVFHPRAVGVGHRYSHALPDEWPAIYRLPLKIYLSAPVQMQPARAGVGPERARQLASRRRGPALGPYAPRVT